MDYPVRTRDQLRSLLVAFRKARNLSQTILADDLGVTQQALSALENDPTSASFERLFNLLSALQVDIVLRTREPAKKPPTILAQAKMAGSDKRHSTGPDLESRPKKPGETPRPGLPILRQPTSTRKVAEKQAKPYLQTRKRDEW
jgi:HTH-type transcriptional regulator / antitoxin HipB